MASVSSRADPHGASSQRAGVGQASGGPTTLAFDTVDAGSLRALAQSRVDRSAASAGPGGSAAVGPGGSGAEQPAAALLAGAAPGGRSPSARSQAGAVSEFSSTGSRFERGSAGGGGANRATQDAFLEHRKAVNPPRFQKASASEVKPGPGAHDIKVEFTRVSKTAVFGFPKDSRSKYLGTSGVAKKEVPIELVKKAQRQAARKLKREAAAAGGGASESSTSQSTTTVEAGTHGAVDGGAAASGSTTLVPKAVAGAAPGGSPAPAESQGATQKKAPTGGARPNRVSSPDDGTDSDEDILAALLGPAPGSYTLADNRFKPQSLTNEAAFGKNCRGGLFAGIPRDVRGRNVGGNPFHDGTISTPQIHVGSPRSNHPASPRGESSTLADSPRGEISGEASSRRAHSATAVRVRKESSLVQAKRKPWLEQVEYFKEKIDKRGPLGLEDHRALTKLVSTPTLEDHKQVAEKEQLKRIAERAMGKKCNQRMMLGAYQTHWPKLAPSK